MKVANIRCMWKCVFGVITLCVFLAARGATDSIVLYAPSGIHTSMGWPFVNKTVGNAFPNPGVYTQLSFWNAASNTWGATITWDDLDEAWSNPNYVLTNGV